MTWRAGDRRLPVRPVVLGRHRADETGRAVAALRATPLGHLALDRVQPAGAAQALRRDDLLLVERRGRPLTITRGPAVRSSAVRDSASRRSTAHAPASAAVTLPLPRSGPAERVGAFTCLPSDHSSSRSKWPDQNENFFPYHGYVALRGLSWVAPRPLRPRHGASPPWLACECLLMSKCIVSQSNGKDLGEFG